MQRELASSASSRATDVSVSDRPSSVDEVRASCRAERRCWRFAIRVSSSEPSAPGSKLSTGDFVVVTDLTWTSPPLAVFEIMAATIEARFGPPSERDLDSNGIGLFGSK